MEIFVFCLGLFCAFASFFTPEQVHLALGNNEDEMTVTWAALAPSNDSVVQYSEVSNLESLEKDLDFQFNSPGIWKKFPNLDFPYVFQRFLFSCSATMKNLKQGKFYKYRVGSDVFGWSEVFLFRAKKNFDEEKISKVIVFGDLGNSPENSWTVASVLKEVEKFEYDAVIHNGDFAYDFNSKDGKKGDIFMREIEPIASKIPYMVAIGNHEKSFRILHYYHRFSMPGDSWNLFYSFNLGKIHFLSYSTELIFDKWSTLQKFQEDFIKSDLKSLNRSKYPFLVVFGHRPLYCSAQRVPLKRSKRKPPLERHNSDCLTQAPLVRKTFEGLWKEFNVDLIVSAHVHAYERIRPVFKEKPVACDEESKNLIVGCHAPVHVISGNPGQDESYAPVSTTPLDISVFQDDRVGYGRITAFNETHLLWEQVISSTSEVSDFLWIVKPLNKSLQK
jgi:Icc-related predicted phosphoesterase